MERQLVRRTAILWATILAVEPPQPRNQMVPFLCLPEQSCAVGHYGPDGFPIIATIDTFLPHSVEQEYT